jgi:hypothetical protein
MRHMGPSGQEEYAMHDVYFGEDDQVITYTAEALSPRRPTVEELRAALKELCLQGVDEVVTGDLAYSYPIERIHEWLQYIDEAPLPVPPG